MSAMADASDAPQDPAGGLLKFFIGGDPVQRCLEHPQLREYVTDAAFCKRLRALRTKCEAASTPEAMGELTRLMLHDPRLTQCSMAGAGMNLSVDAADLKKAERTGDVEKMSPIKVDDVVAAEKLPDSAAAKAEGNTRFAASDSAGALAFWARALRLDRETEGADESKLAAALYGNVAAALLKLGYWARAEQAASRAIAYCDIVENVSIRRRALYRRALAREKRRDVSKAYGDVLAAQKLDPPPAEQKLLMRDALRLLKLTKHADEERKARVQRKVEEAQVAATRTTGVGLKSSAKHRAAPGSTLGYLEESDRSRWASTRLAELLEGVEVDLGYGAFVSIITMDEAESSVSASVTRKRGKRSLYYDVDVKCAWRAEWRGFDLSPSKESPRLLAGSLRLYNVSHETRYEPGADPTVAYMYQVGYQLPRPDWFDGSAATAAAPAWARTLIDGAHELYEAASGAVDALVRELREK